MEGNKTTSGNQSSNRPKRSIKNDKKLNSQNCFINERHDIVFKYKEKRSIKNNKKNSKLKLYLPIIISSILFISSVIFLIIILLKKKSSPPIIKISVSELSYEKAEKILNLPIIEQNHNLLNRSLSIINDSIIICENSNFSIINSTLNYMTPNFLNMATKTALKIVKNDLEFYKDKYEELIENINNFTLQASNSLEISYSVLNDLKKEINNLILDFENIIKNLCVPLIAKEKVFDLMDLRKLNEYELYNNEDIDKISIIKNIELFRNDTEKLNMLYNKLFNFINESAQTIYDGISDIPDLIEELQRDMKNGIINFEEKVLNFTESKSIQYFHENLIEIKNDFISLKNDAKIRQNTIEDRLNGYENNYQDNDYVDISEEVNNTIDNLNSNISLIEDEIIEYGEKNSLCPIEFDKLYASNIIVNSIVSSVSHSTKTIKREERLISNEIESVGVIINVEEKTSLDLLFIMDLTGSMGPYIEQVKNNMINIMNRIPIECPGININLGYIGYRDVSDIAYNYIVNIDFSQNYQQIQNKIKNVIADGGEDYPEEIAWAIEKAIEKNWKSDARYSILVADAPCHGTKYHIDEIEDDYPNGVPGRKNIEILINELAAKNVSLFCMEITEYTDIMFKIFGEIYSNYQNCQFQVVTMATEEKLPDIVVDSAADVYIKQKKLLINKK